jgi:formyltetrahydrofolate-dependent phosphoribosylglycinamide formyltransferase
MKKRVVLISGSGTNLQAVIDAIICGKITDAEISLVVSNRKSAFGLERAKKHAIKTHVMLLKSYSSVGKSRVEYDEDLAQYILDTVGCQPELIILAGFMHILSQEFLLKFTNDVINLHPALPGCFDGAQSIERAFEAFKKGEIKHTGVMVHKVIPEVDRGEPILQRVVDIYPEDSISDLETRIHALEHELLVDATKKILGGF